MSKPVHDVHRVTKLIKLKRLIWILSSAILFRPFPTKVFWIWRWALLRLFGAEVSIHSMVYSSVDIWAPWNLKMAAGSCLGPHVTCYNMAMIELEAGAIVSQYSYLCTAGHKTDELNNATSGLIISTITIGKNAWIGTRAFIGMGCDIGEYSIVGATASVYKDVDPYTIVGGNPAKVIKQRIINRYEGE